MKRLIEQVDAAKLALIGTLSTGTTAILEGVKAAIGILVGLATLFYLVVRIRRELKSL